MHTKRVHRLISTAAGLLLAATAGIIAGGSAVPGTAHAATGQTIADIATRELNDSSRNYEIGNNCSFYGGTVFGWPACGGMPGWGGGGDWYAWCAAFAKYIWREAGGITHLSEIDGFAASFRTYGQNHGTWHARGSGYTPEPGDAIVFDWERDGVIDHVGIVQSVSAGTVYTVEGNSGDRVRRNTYTGFATDTRIVGFTTAVGLTQTDAYHRLRRADGSWTVFGSLGLSGVSAVSSAGDRSGIVHVAAVRNGQIQHRVRYTDGAWSVWGGLGNPGTATALAAATDSTGLLHLATVVNGQIQHRVRYIDSTWSVWGGLGNPGTAVSIGGATDPTGNFHLTTAA